MRTSEPASSSATLFAAELIAARAAAGLAQADLAECIHYSESLVAMIERCRRAPTPDFARRCDEVLGTPGTFARLQQFAARSPLPGWFRPYAEAEATATQLRSWQPMVIDGLLQTPEYARAILAVQPNTTEGELEERVAARLARQVILDRPDPPLLWVLMDEAVLIRQVGSGKIMHEQLLHLADVSHRPNVTIGIVPLSAGAHAGLLGAFAVAEADEAARVGYLESPTAGFTVTQNAVAEIMVTFDTLRADALPRSASRNLIMRRAEEHGPD